MKGSNDVRINLLYYKFEEQRHKSYRLKEYAVLGMILLLLAAMAVGINMQQQKQIAGIKADNQVLQKEVEALQKVETFASISNEELAGIESRRALVERLEKEAKLDPAFLEDIYIASEDVIINKMAVKAGELDVNAYADSQAQFIDFIDRLKSNPRITNIKNLSSKLNEKNGEVNFSLTLEWEVQ